jgi:hypothetical protein
MGSTICLEKRYHHNEDDTSSTFGQHFKSYKNKDIIVTFHTSDLHVKKNNKKRIKRRKHTSYK